MCNTYRFLIMTTDPVHIGTGGMRLGRVDNTIVREPGTKLPKIPGTALHGAIRAYAARRYGKPQCAGQGSTEGRKHCGRPTCPICYTFGSLQGEAGSFSGVVSISDARILLFPVYSMLGPVWVTSPDTLKGVGLENFSVDQNKAKWSDSLTGQNFLNLGWLMVERDGNGWTLSKNLKDKLPEPIKNRVVLVSDKLFSQIVNSNLEVRTSVAINPETGAAEEGALYTYEAIPRATLLWFDLVVDNFRNNFPTKNLWEELYEKIKSVSIPEEMPEIEEEYEKIMRALGYIKKRPTKREKETNGGFDERKKQYWKRVKESYESLKKVIRNLNWSSPEDIINLGLEWAEHLGIGGMGTRGFGRIKKVVDPWEV